MNFGFVPLLLRPMNVMPALLPKVKTASGRTGEKPPITNGTACVAGTNRGGLHILSFRGGQGGFATKEVTSGALGLSPTSNAPHSLILVACNARYKSN